MFNILNITNNQKLDLPDTQRIGGVLARHTNDKLLYGIIGAGGWYRGFKCSDKGSGQLNVDNGEIYIDGVGYYDETLGGFTMDLLKLAPAVNFAIAAITVSPNPQLTDVRPTTYLTDSTSRSTTGRDQPRLDSRLVKIGAIMGRSSPDPLPPTASDIPNGNVVVAYVKVGPGGIVSIQANALALLPSAEESRRRLDNTDQWRTDVSATIDALGTNMAAIQGALKNLPSVNFVLNMAADLSRVKEKLNIPQIFTLYGSDHYLTNDYSYTTHVDYLATVEEGIRFPDANKSDSQLGLQNIYDGSVVNIANMLYPKFSTRVALSNTAHDTTVICNQYQYQTITVQQLTMTRERIRTGPWYQICTNWFWWIAGGGTYDALRGIFRLYSGEAFEILPEDRNLMSGITSHETSTHLPIRIRQVWFDGLEDVPYTNTILGTASVSGAFHGNTFLCPQDGWLPQLNLYFSQKAAAGDVTVMMLQVPSSGQPDLTKVIGRTTIKVADIQVSTAARKVATPAVFAPLLAMQKGQRYAFTVVTQGAHSMWQSDGNKLAQGSHFVSTDGQWAIGDLTKDLCFDLVFAQFDAPQIEVQLLPLQLDGGIVKIDILAQMYAPSGTNIAFMVQHNGVWRNVMDFTSDTSPLNALPPLLPFKAVFTGTTDMMPALGVAANSRVTCARPRSDFRHLSIIERLPVGVTTQTITVTTRMEAWRGAGFHTQGLRLRTGATYTTYANPAAVKDTKDPNDPQAIVRTYTFSLASAVDSFIIEQTGTTTNVVQTFHVSEMNYSCQ